MRGLPRRAREGNVAVGAPALAGQSATYVQRQLRELPRGRCAVRTRTTRSARRCAPRSQATLRDDAAIEAVATYVASLPKLAVEAAGEVRRAQRQQLLPGQVRRVPRRPGEGNVHFPRRASPVRTPLT